MVVLWLVEVRGNSYSFIMLLSTGYYCTPLPILSFIYLVASCGVHFRSSYF